MAELSSGTPMPSGRGTVSGGGPPAVVTPPPPPPVVTNQQLLVLDSNVLGNLPEGSARAIGITQLEFARDVSSLAAAAYGRILEQLRQRDD